MLLNLTLNEEIVDTFLLSQLKYVRTTMCGEIIGRGLKPSEPPCFAVNNIVQNCCTGPTILFSILDNYEQWWHKTFFNPACMLYCS